MHKKRLLPLVLCVFLFPIEVFAEESTLKDDIIITNGLLEEILKSEYEEEVCEIKDYVSTNGYDYTLSMETLYDKGNPYANMDSLGLIASYLTVSNNDLTIADIDFLNATYEEKTITEKEPYRYVTYEEDENEQLTVERVHYLTSDGYIPTYTITDGIAKEVGTEYITLAEVDTTYVDVTVNVITPDEILEKYPDEIEDGEYERRLNKLKESSLSSEGLSESIMLSLSGTVALSDEEKQMLEESLALATPNRQALVNTAVSLIGRVPYEWGGKSTKSGYDNTWWTIDANGLQKGLDCSGFVQWAFRTCGYENYNLLGSSADILKNATEITKDELEIGDIGVLNHGEETNHVGIYVGNGYFVHCSSEKNTVVISQFPFSIFMRVADFDSTTLISEQKTEETYSIPYTDEDVTLLATLINHEARGEGLNGWIAVAEVVKNRVACGCWGSTIESVIFSEGQFQDVENLVNETPTEEMLIVARQVLDGSLSVLGNSDVLYFRNPHSDTNEDWGEKQFFTRINNHVFYTNNGCK